MSDTERMSRAVHEAEVAIKSAQDKGLLQVSAGFLQQASEMVRLEMLSQAFVFSRNGQWIRDSAERPDWEYAQLFGYLTRLAKYEIAFGVNAKWQNFLELFRVYFGDGIDKLAPSVYLAAVFHPDTIVTQELLADVENMVGSLWAEQTAYNAMNEHGTFF
jgi:hypothetical protein